jgi:hypothetical protein
MIEKSLQIELTEMIQQWMKEDFGDQQPVLPKKGPKKVNFHDTGEVVPLKDCFHPHRPLRWDDTFFQTQLREPIVSTFGIPVPQGNNLLVVVGDSVDEPSSFVQLTIGAAKRLADESQESKDQEDEDYLYKKFDSSCSFYVLDVYGFYVSSRRGTKPSIVTTVLRKPASRAVAENLAWKEWESVNPLIPQPNLHQLVPQALQVERYSCPVHFMLHKFHCSVPFLQDPSPSDEYLYPFVGFKIYEKYVDLHIPLEVKQKWGKILHPVFQKNIQSNNSSKTKISFHLDDSVVQKGHYLSVPNRRKEQTIKVYFATSHTWNRSSLFNPKNPNYIFQSKLQLHKTNLLHLTFPSLPQQSLETLLLSSPNPLIYNKLNSAYRGFTHAQTLLRQWKKKVKDEQES